MALNKADVSAIIGNSVSGSFWGYSEGVYKNIDSINIDSDLSALGFLKLGFVSPDDGVESSVEFDSTDVLAWGKQMLFTDFSNGKETVTVNHISFFDVDCLKFLKGEANIKNYTTTNGTATAVYENLAREMSAMTIVLLGEGRYGRRVMKVIPEGIADPNDDYTWNDSDIVSRPISIICSTAVVNEKTTSSVLHFDNIATSS